MQKILRFFTLRLGLMADSICRWFVRLHLIGCGIYRPSQVFSYTCRAELDQLFLLALHQRERCRMLEIGSHFGGSTVFLGAGAIVRQGRLYCVDTWMNDNMGNDGVLDTWETFCRNTRSLGSAIQPIRARSCEFDRRTVESPLDLVFIDGDHSYAGVRADFDYLKPLLGRDTIVVFHDTKTEGVGRFLGELLSSAEWVVLGQKESLVWLARGCRFRNP